MAADFQKVEHIGTFGNIGSDGDTLELNRVSVDGRPPRLHIGRWTADGQHKRWSGFLTEALAVELRDFLDGMKLDGGNK